MAQENKGHNTETIQTNRITGMSLEVNVCIRIFFN